MVTESQKPEELRSTSPPSCISGGGRNITALSQMARGVDATDMSRPVSSLSGKARHNVGKVFTSAFPRAQDPVPSDGLRKPSSRNICRSAQTRDDPACRPRAGRFEAQLTKHRIPT